MFIGFPHLSQRFFPTIENLRKLTSACPREGWPSPSAAPLKHSGFQFQQVVLLVFDRPSLPRTVCVVLSLLQL